jgi:hypothetical protein
VLRVRGEGTPDVLVAAFREFLAEPTTQVLWDLRECRLGLLTLEQMRDLVSRMMGVDRRHRTSGRSAFLCAREEDVTIMRILVAYAEASGYGIDLAVFDDLAAARRWLGGRPPGLSSKTEPTGQ